MPDSQPFDKPIASYGPFVMTSREEVVTTIRDYRSGWMGNVAE